MDKINQGETEENIKETTGIEAIMFIRYFDKFCVNFGVIPWNEMAYKTCVKLLLHAMLLVPTWIYLDVIYFQPIEIYVTSERLIKIKLEILFKMATLLKVILDCLWFIQNYF